MTALTAVPDSVVKTKTKEQLDTENYNKLTRIDQLHSEQEKAYHVAIDAAVAANENQQTIGDSIRKAALALEEIFKLHGQDFMIQEIGSIIVRDLKTRGFPESKYIYVYHALESYGSRFVKSINHTSVESLAPAKPHTELFYKENAKRYYEAIETLKKLKDDHSNLLRKDIQNIVPKIMDIYDDNEKACKTECIAFANTTQKEFDGGPEKFEDPIRIHKPEPRVPETLTEELNIWITSFLPSLIKKFTEYPISDSTVEKRMANGWGALRHLFDPVTDDKYREMYPDWIEIVHFADESFKHHAASHFKTSDWRGLPRKLTREQIGARQKSIPDWCNWFFKTIPGFLETMVWFRDDKKKYTAGFSIDLSDKLSDRSLR